MEIARIAAVPLKRELDERFANAQKWIDSREYCLVRVETTDGVVGWGECWGPIAGNRELIDEFVGPRLIGESVDDVERIHDELRFTLEAAYHSYVPASALSGVDIALWDAYGKSVGKPVSQLLGGRRRDEVRVYATGHFFSDVETFDALKADIVEEARSHVDAGFDALKQKIGLDRHFSWGHEKDVELVRAVRDAIGDDVTLMIDANHAYDLATARHVARKVADLDIRFFEEPVPPEIEYYVQLARSIDVPLATGECFAFQHAFDRLVQEGAIAYAQPDVTSAGGITSTHRIAHAVTSANVQCVPHAFGSAVGLAASLQIMATVPGNPLLEFDRTPNPLREDLPTAPVTNRGTVIDIADSPGIGIEIDDRVLERFAVD